MTADASDLADALMAALKAPTSHAQSDPLVSGEDPRDVLIDGHFDLVAMARHLRDTLHREMIDLLAAARS